MNISWPHNSHPWWTLIYIFTFAFLNSGWADEKSPYYQLAADHAPVVFQKTGPQPKADAITRFDFDGDWSASNNWKNLSRYPTPAAVYYDVRETLTHYFISYSFFHPRDYSYLCIPWICHENDLEGATLVIQKIPGTKGQLVAVQTLAHDYIYHHDQIVAPETIRHMASQDEGNLKASLFIEWGGHGVYSYDPIEERRVKEGETLVIHHSSAVLEAAHEKHKKNWLVYYFGGEMQDPNGAAAGVYSYDLLPVYEELWQRREEIGRDALYLKAYDYLGARFALENVPAAFAGRQWSRGSAKPPWAWKDKRKKAEYRGDWFFDPALFTRGRMKIHSSEFSLNYLSNPYPQ